MSEFSTPFPRLSDDPLEQFLIHEAVMTRYHADIAEAEHHAQQREDASTRAKDMLSAYRGGA